MHSVVGQGEGGGAVLLHDDLVASAKAAASDYLVGSSAKSHAGDAAASEFKALVSVASINGLSSRLVQRGPQEGAELLVLSGLDELVLLLSTTR